MCMGSSLALACRAVKTCVHAWYVLSLSQTARLKQGNVAAMDLLYSMVAAMALQLSTPNGTAAGIYLLVE